MNGALTPDTGVPVGVPLAPANTPVQSADSGRSGRTTATTTTRSSVASSVRTGRRGLSAVRSSLSARDWDVLRIVDRHRYLTTRQIEGFCFTGHATALTGARVARRVLRRLQALRVLAHLQRRIGGVRAGSASYVWRVGAVGDRLLQEERGAARRRQREPSELFLAHSLAIADLHLAALSAHRANTLELLEVQTEPDCWRPYTGLGGARLMLKPDLAITTGAGDYLDRWMVELDRGSEHPKRLLAKCAKYEAYRRSGTEQATWGSFPLVVWVMRGQPEADRLMSAIRADRSLDERLFRTTTSDGFVGLLREGAV